MTGKTLWIAALTLAGCAPVSATLSPPGWLEDPVTPVDTGDTGDTGLPVEDEPVRWVGERAFTFDWCEDTVSEAGVEITADPEWADAVSTCGQCQQVFLVEMSPESLCQGVVPLETPAIRGLIWGEHGADIYAISEADGGWSRALLAEARRVGSTGLEYHYSDALWGSVYDVQGTATIE